MNEELRAVEFLRERWLALGFGVLLPLALAAIWIPVRTDLPNTDLALILVMGALAVGLFGHRGPIVMASLSGPLWFEFFDTRPFGTFAIERLPDIEITIVLAVVSFLAGELALRAVHYRKLARSESRRLGRIEETAGLLASGEELVAVIEAVGVELQELLHLEDCVFSAEPSATPHLSVNRNGTLSKSGELGDLPDHPRGPEVELPIWGHSQVFGYFLLRFPFDAPPPRHGDLVLSVALADQVGAAFMTQAPPPPDPVDTPEMGLHVVQ